MASLQSGLVCALGLAVVAMTAGCEQPDKADTADVLEQQESPVSGGSAIMELQSTDIISGDGTTAEPGKLVRVHYTGWLYEPGAADNKGAKFDSSVDRGEPFVFPLGAGRVIKGWDEGVAGMQVGGKRVLIIPPDMAYGDRGAGAAIPPDSTLLFEVELLEVQ